MGGTMSPLPRPPVRDREARNVLVLQYSKLPGYVVNRLWKCYTAVRKLGYDDAVQIGYVTLLRAAELWEEDRNVSFMTYAYSAIRRGIYDAVRCKSKSNDPLETAWSFTQKNDDGTTRDNLLPSIRDRDRLMDREAIDMLRILPERMRTIVWRTVVEGQSYKILSQHYKISCERVRQIRKTALQRLARILEGTYKKKENDAD